MHDDVADVDQHPVAGRQAFDLDLAVAGVLQRAQYVIRQGADVAMRTARDKTLAMPRLIIPSLQVNIRGGELPPRDKDGRTFLKVPVNAL